MTGIRIKYFLVLVFFTILALFALRLNFPFLGLFGFLWAPSNFSMVLNTLPLIKDMGLSGIYFYWGLVYSGVFLSTVILFRQDKLLRLIPSTYVIFLLIVSGLPPIPIPFILYVWMAYVLLPCVALVVIALFLISPRSKFSKQSVERGLAALSTSLLLVLITDLWIIFYGRYMPSPFQ